LVGCDGSASVHVRSLVEDLLKERLPKERRIKLGRLERAHRKLEEPIRKQVLFLIDCHQNRDRAAWALRSELCVEALATYSEKGATNLAGKLRLRTQRHARKEHYLKALQTFGERRQKLLKDEKKKEELASLGPVAAWSFLPDYAEEELANLYGTWSVERLEEECHERRMAEYTIDERTSKRRRIAIGVPGRVALTLRKQLRDADAAFRRCCPSTGYRGLSKSAILALAHEVGVKVGDKTIPTLVENMKCFDDQQRQTLYTEL